MRKMAIAVVLAAFVACPAVAADAYVGLNLGSNKMGYSDVKASSAYSLLFGYFFRQNIAAEVEYASFGSAEMTGSTNKVTGNAVSLSAIGFLPVNKTLSMFGKLGVATTKLEVIEASFLESKTYLAYGFGAQYNFGNSIGFRLGYDSFKVGSTDTQNSNFTYLGALYKF